MEISIGSLHDFYIRAQMEYQDFRYYFKLDQTNKDLENLIIVVDQKQSQAQIDQQIDELRSFNFKELCYRSNVTEEEVQFYESLLL